jgi:branched-chain amino acid transport system permease protein
MNAVSTPLARRGALLFGLAAVALAGAFAPQYIVFELGMVALWAVGVLGVTVLTGYNGQLSVASNTFMALGAYTAAILAADHGWDYWWTVPASAVVGFVSGILLGVPALRVRGFYLTTLTLAVAVLVPPFIKRLENVTHGVAGIQVTRPSTPEWVASVLRLDMANYQWRFALTSLAALLVFWFVRRLLKGQIGRALLAIKDTETAAEANGVDLVLHKTFAFALSSACAAVAGALYAFNVGLVGPDAFSIFLSVNVVAAAVVGGVKSQTGALIGALLLVFVPSVAGEINESLSGFAFGAVLIASILLMPGGIAGLTRSLAGGLGNRVQRAGRPVPAIESRSGGEAPAQDNPRDVAIVSERP